MFTINCFKSQLKSLIEDTKIGSFNDFSSLLGSAFAFKQVLGSKEREIQPFFVFKTLQNNSSANNVIEMVHVKSDIFYFLCCSELIFFVVHFSSRNISRRQMKIILYFYLYFNNTRSRKLYCLNTIVSLRIYFFTYLLTYLLNNECTLYKTCGRYSLLTFIFSDKSLKTLKSTSAPPGSFGLPSVSTIKILGLSGLSPPSTVNSSSFAILRARSVRVRGASSSGSLAIFCSRAP